ncbi:MAG: uridine kinase [Candidatus Sumerlaea sp.]|uniref:Uridine kinase n=1 Tax=Sumerlaea chitinivorans TaxID=2250252 RepID=A0A2Z4Y3P1_SUMC1|nr:Uridine kinase [Candidatus Sumerlaea chitinivorans]GIX44212.1 MAG: uridine kinase [Candidatus Sumerlaea sp.]
MKRMLLGIAGGTGSGKTLVAKSIGEAVGKQVVILGLDSYYLDRSDLPFEERAKINYDHPDAFDIPLLLEHLHKLMRGEAIEMPVYNYAAHARAPETIHVEPAPIIIVEGILVLAIPALRDMMNVRIFVDTDADVRFIRRLSRDVKERGRSLQSVIDQYLNVVRLMHLEFVEPSKRYADIIVPEGGYNKVAIDFIVTKLKTLLDE